jgi:integrase
MSSVYKRGDSWVVRWKDGAGKWREKRSEVSTRADAQRLADDLSRKAERQRLGLEPLPVAQAPMSFSALLDWWWEEYGSRLRSAANVKPFMEHHLRGRLGKLSLIEVTPARIEKMLNDLAPTRKPATLNQLRGLVHRVFELATRRGLWVGMNPAKAVERRKVVRGLPQHLKAEEVPRMLAELDAKWRPLFAAAVYTGMRKGELLGLRKSDLDFDEGTITVARSYDGETTKSGRAAVIPMAEGLWPYLAVAVQASSSKLVFPRDDGGMHSRELGLEHILRRALSRAGIVDGYVHKCRRRGCGHEVRATSAEAGKCPKCTMQLWVKPVARPVRFHDLRHTTATLLLKAGVPFATVQRILRHTDPRLTTEIYGHLDVEDMRRGINELRFPGLLAAPVPRARPGEKVEGPGPADFYWSGRQDLNLRPLGPERARADWNVIAARRKILKPIRKTRRSRCSPRQRVQWVARLLLPDVLPKLLPDRRPARAALRFVS